MVFVFSTIVIRERERERERESDSYIIQHRPKDGQTINTSEKNQCQMIVPSTVKETGSSVRAIPKVITVLATTSEHSTLHSLPSL